MVVAAPGTQALIQVLPRLFPQRRISIPGFTYAEHAAAWAASGAMIDDDTPARAPARAPARVLCNPNNPDGRSHDPATLAAHTDQLLVVDEAFADFVPALSLAPFLPLPRTIILRSFGKSYGLAGLRLGFALAEPAAAACIRAALGPWAVSGPAIAIGLQALGDTAWKRAALLAARRSAQRMDTLLAVAGLRIVGGTTLFRLAETANAAPIAEGLAQAGILVRSFATAPTWLRFGLPADEAAWSRLSTTLTQMSVTPGAT
jgi:cobalamin biosynthetic protein CobC